MSLQPISATDLIGETLMELAEPSAPRRGPADGNGDVLDEQVLTTPSTAPHPPRSALNDDELTRRLRDFKPSGAL
jgi:hypothetical protein